LYIQWKSTNGGEEKLGQYTAFGTTLLITLESVVKEAGKTNFFIFLFAKASYKFKNEFRMFIKY
jgi:hypothetical protein